MASDDYIQTKTSDGQTVFLNKSQIGAIEVQPGSARSEGQLKVYVSGYKFVLQIRPEDFLAALNLDLEP